MAVSQIVRAAVTGPGAATGPLSRRRHLRSGASLGKTAALAPRRPTASRPKAATIEARRASDPIFPPMITGRRPEESTDLMTHLLRNRIIFIGTRITDQTCTEIVAKLMALEAADPKKDIKLYINSQGGQGYAIVGILDAMRNCKCDISTVAFGMVAANAAVILSSGTKGKRYSMEHTRIMLAQPFGGMQGSAEEVNIQASELNRTMKVMVQFLMETTGMSKEAIEMEIDRETFLGAQKAIDMGIIDAVI
mmetsp:Transcript_3863/g.9653  ORF Transcript_3863/g.9653 Transcript_3863/m.9653 type:complete len:250 (+) Transcript_3863:139-888(+)|eukprot:jgi/Tetstr1/430539/TSEL_020337.t1